MSEKEIKNTSGDTRAGAAEEGTSSPAGEEREALSAVSERKTVVPEEKQSAGGVAIACLGVLASAVLRGVGSYTFVRPNGFADGGVSGVAIMLQYLTGVNLGWYNLAINIPLLVAAYFFLSKRFVLLTTAHTVLYSVTVIAMEQLDRVLGGALIYHDEPVAMLSAVFGGVLCGMAFAVMIRVGGSQGGTDIVAAIVNKRRPDMSLSWLIFGIDGAIILASVFVYSNGFTPILLALINVFAAGAVSDVFIKGAKSAIKAEIVTVHSDEICAEIIDRLGRGVTVVSSVGGYTGEERKLLNCVIARRQLGDLRHILKKYDGTFSYIMPADEVYGYWTK